MSEIKFKFYNSITETTGNTPLIKLQKMTSSRNIGATVLVKAEFLNPTGSIKDRMAVYVLDRAAERGDLKPGGTIVEATSGNTGAAVAMYASANGYKSILTIPDKMSKEKVDMLKALGAEVHVCKTAVPAESPESYYETGKRLHRETKDSYWVGQYFNLDNIEAHYMLTGPEIWKQTKGQIDCLVGGIGTGGTMSGTAKYLKEQNSDVEVVGVDPIGSVYYQFHKDKTMVEPHTYFVEGIGEDMLCPTMDFSVIDRVYQVTDKESFVTGRELARTEGIFGGGSSGAAVHAALKHAATLDDSKIVIVILPDSGMKYISKMYDDEWMKQNGMME